jgi:sialate O-acetylesterase
MKSFRACLVGLAAALVGGSVYADVRLPRLVGDGLVLQHGEPVVMWGWADEGERVTVSLGDKQQVTTAKDGRWELSFKPLKAGDHLQILVQGKNTIEVKNVVAGDVWIAAGQSNMELPINRVLTRYPDLIRNTNLPDVREFSVPVRYSFQGPQEDYTKGEWKAATPDHLGSFSAVGFFFARDLHQKYQVPIGLISIAVGGSPAEAWVSESALQKYPQHLAAYQKFKDDAVLQKTIADDKARVDAWYAQARAEDKGLQGNWSAASSAVVNWPSLTVPGSLREQKIDFINGILWLHKTLRLNAQQAAQDGKLWLGAIVDGDEVYINGQLVGQTGYQYPPRIYPVKAGVLKAGENHITIRLTSYSSNPGFVKDKTYALQLGDESISLQGQWQYQVGMRSESFPQTTTIHYQPASLFNAKLAPALHSGIKGVIWYQGESNTSRAPEYETLFPDLIKDWRKQFNQGDFPFLYVQLANFMLPKAEPGESDWAKLREAQRQTLKVKNTAMVTAIDAGEWNDIHPLDKQVVGERLALAAGKLAYNDKRVVASAPNAKSLKRTKDGLLVHFDGSDLMVKGGGEIKQIAIAGADNKYVWAKAKIQGKKLLVWSEQIPDPVSVRYAWADNPEGANLYNSAGLPLSPFELSL